MRTTLDLPEALVKEAMKAAQQRSKTATIITALQEMIRKNRLQQVKAFRGKISLNIDLDVIRKRT